MRQETRVRTKIFCLTIGALLFELCAFAVLIFSLCSSAQAQQPTKIPRIGYLVISSLSGSASRAEAFRQGLRELGYVEGKNIVIEWRSAEGKRERGPALAEELVRLKVDVLVTLRLHVNIFTLPLLCWKKKTNKFESIHV